MYNQKSKSMIYIQIPEISRLISRQKNIRHISWMKRFLERLLQIVNPPARLANTIRWTRIFKIISAKIYYSVSIRA